MSIDYGGLAALLPFAAFALFVGVLVGSKAVRHFFAHWLRFVIFGVRNGFRAAKDTANGFIWAVLEAVREVRLGGRQ